MEPGPETLKTRRKKADLTQKELSKLSGISQSMIAKIESGRADPSFKTMRTLNQVLDRHGREKERTVKEIMNSPVLSFSKDTPLEEAIDRMAKNGYSQAPVIKEGRSLGTLTERSILNRMDEGRKEKEVKNAMVRSLPNVPSSSPVRVALELLKSFDGILIEENGDIIGIVTRTDLLMKYL